MQIWKEDPDGTKPITETIYHFPWEDSCKKYIEYRLGVFLKPGHIFTGWIVEGDEQVKGIEDKNIFKNPTTLSLEGYVGKKVTVTALSESIECPACDSCCPDCLPEIIEKEVVVEIPVIQEVEKIVEVPVIQKVEIEKIVEVAGDCPEPVPCPDCGDTELETDKYCFIDTIK